MTNKTVVRFSVEILEWLGRKSQVSSQLALLNSILAPGEAS